MDAMILNIENPKEFTENPKEFSKLAGYNISIQKSVAFLYTFQNEQSEKKI